MKQYPKLLFIVLLFISTSSVYASWRYHGVATQRIFTREGKLYLEETYKDDNGISYISQDTAMIADDIDLAGFETIAQTPESIIFITNSAYYMVIKKDRWLNPKKTVEKLYNRNEVTGINGGYFFRVGGKWKYVYAKAYVEKLFEKNLEILPSKFDILTRFNDYGPWLILRDDHNIYLLNIDNGDLIQTFVSSNKFEILAQGDRGKMLIKTDKDISSYNIKRSAGNNRSGELAIVPKLVPSRTRILFEEGRRYNFLWDDDTMYLLNSDLEPEDITPQFNYSEKGHKFLFVDFMIDDNYGASFIDVDNIMWVCVKNGPSTTVYSLGHATYYDRDRYYILYDDKVYRSGWNVVNKIEGINPECLKYIYNYSCSENFPFLAYRESYYWKDENNCQLGLKFEKCLTSHAKLISSQENTYLYEDGNNFVILNNNELTEDSILIRSLDAPLKNLTIAYAARNFLIIGSQIFKNIANRDDMEFLGSTVRIIRGEDNAGTPPAKIDYFIFFRDKKNVYYHYTGLNEIKIIKGVNPNNYSVDNFGALKYLESLTHEMPIEEAYGY